MLSRTKKIHFIGIGGIGMSGIAELLHSLQFIITGSDLNVSDRTNYLSNLGINIKIGHSNKNINNPDLVVYSSAVKLDNIEIVESQNKSIPIIRRAEMLGELLKLKKTSIAISGTHGKTTTCSMLSSILFEAKLNPTLVIGGIVNNFGSNAISGEGDVIVVEADEFDRSFLSLKPTMGIINNLDLEHTDCYKDIEDLKNTFITFANALPFYGIIGLCLDDDNVKNIINKIKRPYKTFGLTQEADIHVEDIQYSGFNSNFKLFNNNKFLIDINLPSPGKHNIQNSLAAITMALELGIDIKIIKKGLNKYNGVKRRLEVTHSLDNGTIFIDDYAHHPSEVKASISAIKKSFSNRVVTIFQPHLYSRTLNFYNDFAKALSLSDVLILLDIYPAREKPINNVSSKLIYNEMIKNNYKDIFLNNDISILPEMINKIHKNGDIIITMGAGDVYKQNNIIFEAIS
jgi:UDP-N-acetylmuramate--alanine ligase